MVGDNCLSVIQTIIDMQKDMVVVFDQDYPIVTNRVFNKFFGVSSTQEYRDSFGPLIDSFVPHPLYFHKEKIEKDIHWLDAVMQLEEKDRIVSMLTQTYDPCAYSISVNQSIDNYKVVTLVDITRDLIKRLMMQNNSNIDKTSGAYDKKYFLEISENFEEASRFNEKKIAILSLTLSEEDSLNTKLQEFVERFKTFIRQDDMLVRWGDSQFLLIYLVDSNETAERVVKKLQTIASSGHIPHCDMRYSIQKEGEGIKALLKRV